MTVQPEPGIVLSGATQGKPARTHGFFFRLVTILLCGGGIVLLLYLDSLLGEHAATPLAGESLNYGLLFLTGVLTGFHCIGMCGPLVLSYSVHAAKEERGGHSAHFFYALGKTLSYTAIGALFGALGAIVTFTPFLRGVAGIAAGVFLILFGLHILNVLAALQHFWIKTPGFLMRFIGWSMKKHGHPFSIGLLNGLMIICGPLQAMYIMAAGTGSPIEGAKLLLVFGTGTLPVMLGFGVLTSTLSARVAPQIIRASGFIVIALGAIMLNRGLAMTGTGYDFDSLVTRYFSEAHRHTGGVERQDGYRVIRMEVNVRGFLPNQFTLYKGEPVRWLIDGKEITQCNERIVVPKLGLDFAVKQGANVVEFTPQAAGVIPWSCWMGMMPGAFLVENTPTALEPSHDVVAVPEQHAPEQRWALWLKKLQAWLNEVGRRLQSAASDT